MDSDNPEVLAALDLSNGQTVEYGAAFALALAGDSARSATLAADLAKRFPDDTIVKFSFLPSLRALAALKSAGVYELASQDTAEGFNPSFYPVYVRALSYLDSRFQRS